MTNRGKLSSKLSGVKVNVSWVGAVPTFVATERWAKKVKLKPGESIKVSMEIAQRLAANSKFLIDADKKEIKAATDASVKAYNERAKRATKAAKAKKEAELERAKNKVNNSKQEEVEEEDLEELEEDDVEQNPEDDEEVGGEGETEEEEEEEGELDTDVEEEKKAE